MAEAQIHLRPHHLPMIEAFLFGTYSHPGGDLERMRNGFGDSLVKKCQEIAEKIKKDSKTQIYIARGEDDLCVICNLHFDCAVGMFSSVKKALGSVDKNKYENPQQLDARVMRLYEFFYGVKEGSSTPAERIFGGK